MEQLEFCNRKYWIRLWALAYADFKMRDQGTFFGFLWTLFHPLVYFLVLYTLFENWMGSSIPHFSVYLIIGIVQWNFFSAATSSSIGAIWRYSTFIKSFNCPKSLMVISTIISVLISHLLELFTLLVFLLITQGTLPLTIFGLVPLLLLNLYLVVSMSFLLATVGVYFLDMQRIWGLLTNIGLFLTPIFYSLDVLSPEKRGIIMMNPMTHIIKASRVLVIDRKMPDAGGLLYVVGLSTFLLIIGYRIFKAKEGSFIEKL